MLQMVATSFAPLYYCSSDLKLRFSITTGSIKVLLFCIVHSAYPHIGSAFMFQCCREEVRIYLQTKQQTLSTSLRYLDLMSEFKSKEHRFT